MFDIKSHVRANILAMKPYSSARDEFEGEARVYIDANENNLGSLAQNQAFNRYPDPNQKQLKAKIAELKGVKATQIFLGNGSDEAIDLLIRLVCKPGHDEILTFSPTYGMYDVAANLNDVYLRHISLDEHFQIQISKLQGQIHANTKIIFICSPNNPTGNIINPASIEYIIKNFDGLVVVDEAYIDFAPSESWLKRLTEFPNLVVLQTFSKAWGMAALRLGMAFGSVEIINFLTKIKAPYNINEATQLLAMEALQQAYRLPAMVAAINQERDHLQQVLPKLPVVRKTYPTDANFILAEVTDANRVYKYLLSKGIVVRNRTSQTGCLNCLRISIGTKEENQALIKALEAFPD
jgi:histidinol-phosphate aminotransferase